MNLINILGSPWAIIPDRLNQICDILNTHLRGPKLNLKDMEAKIMASDAKSFENVTKNQTVIIPIAGPIMKNPDIFDRVMIGAVSSSRIKDDFLASVNDPGVAKIIFYIDSPGGTVDGTQELAQTIFENRGKKPVLTFTDGMIASAAYWIASATDKIYISGNTVNIGSIGVIASHTDYSKMDEKYGIKTTEIVAGKFKNIASPNAPLSDEGKAWFQDRVDYLYSVFVGDVARNRGVKVETVLSKMADAQIFIGQQAIQAGLVDGVSTIDALIDIQTHSIAGVAVTANLEIKEVPNMELTIEILKEKFSAIYNQVFEAGKVAGKAEINVEDEKKAGMKAEADRIKSVKAQLIPGHEALIEKLMFDGVTTGEQAAVQIVQAEKGKMEAKMNALKEDKEKNHVDGAEKIDKVQTNADAPLEDRAKAEWDKSPEVRAEFGNDYKAFFEYKKNSEAGNVRIMGGTK